MFHNREICIVNTKNTKSSCIHNSMLTILSKPDYVAMNIRYRIWIHESEVISQLISAWSF